MSWILRVFVPLSIVFSIVLPPMLLLVWVMEQVPSTKGFIRSPLYQDYGLILILLFLIIGLAFFVYSDRQGSPMEEYLSVKHRLYIIVGLMFFSYLNVTIAYPLTLYFLPDLKEGSVRGEILTIEKTSIQGSSCRIEVRLHQDDGLFNNLCFQDEALEEFYTGDSVILTGLEIPYMGLHVLSMEKLKTNP